MPFVKREVEDGYIVVHHLFGDHEAIEFLRATSRQELERLCNQAKREGEAMFNFKNEDFVLIRNKDATYSVYRENERPEGVAYLDQ
jgi:hypothetical protein